MQVQKEEIKNRIMEAALEEFLLSGYRQSSMRNIAEQARITVGNIYSYFSGKDDLFENILEPAVQQLGSLVLMDVSYDSPLTNSTIEHITSSITKVFLDNRVEFLILMNGSEGSKYENIKGDIIKLAKHRIAADLLPKLPLKAKDSLLADSLAVAMIEGLLNIFNKYGGDEERLNCLVSEFLLVMLGDITEKLGDITEKQ